MNFSDRVVLFLATGSFVGKIPGAPGTFGSLLALPLCFVLSRLHLIQAAACIALFSVFAALIAHLAETILDRKDPGCIVIDEMAGQMVTLAGMPFGLMSASAGFVVFRMLDILKPFPIRLVEQKVKGGAGVVLDDVAAGILGNILLRIVFYYIETTHVLHGKVPS
jgi:phosphatidylglycerophosphatase A